MKKENECEIVQDLLLNYTDGLLNNASKEFVENHLKDCSICKEKLKNIENDEKNITKQEREIDYLKKIRLKSRIKSIIGAIIIIILIFLGYYFSKFFVINSISEKASKAFESENFYVEKISSLAFGEDGVLYDKTWYKDGKFKNISYIETQENGITQTFDTEYGETDKKEQYLINDNEKKATKVLYPFTYKKSDFASIPNPIFLSTQKYYMFFRLGTPFHVKISTDHREIGRKYYVLKLGDSTLWVDIDTGLPIMSFGYSSNTRYYKDTKIPLEKSETICQYIYQFNTVKDDDVALPDLSEYKIENTDFTKDIK